jgi:hypothetical protein
MKLTEEEFHILCTHSGKAHAAQAIRQRLRAGGYQWCPVCGEVHLLTEFCTNGRCHTCMRKWAKRKRIPYTPLPDSKARGARARAAPGYATKKNERQRRTYAARRALGMTPKQADYHEESNEFADEWQKFLDAS